MASPLTSFPVKRGTRQGDPLSSYLFILVIEVLSVIVSTNSKITGSKIGNQEIKQCLFADDASFLLDGLNSLHELQNVIEEFCSNSTMKVNGTKSQIAWIGLQRHSAGNIGS